MFQMYIFLDTFGWVYDSFTPKSALLKVDSITNSSLSARMCELFTLHRDQLHTIHGISL